MSSVAPISTRTAPPPAHLSTRDGTKLHYQVHTAAPARGTVVVAHGFAEHGGRYLPLVETLVPAGWTVLTYDARGHGLSGGKRVYVEKFSDYTEDLREVLGFAGRTLPGPLYLFGHSMGGLVALRLMLDAPELVRGLLVSNPALANRLHVPAWKTILAKYASDLLPTLKVPTGLLPQDMSHDPEMVRAYENDPLNSKVATARWYTEYIAAQAEVVARASELRKLPTLALLGGGDRVIDSSVAVDFFAKLGDTATVHMYPGLYHELINEPLADRTRVLGDMRAWLDSRG